MTVLAVTAFTVAGGGCSTDKGTSHGDYSSAATGRVTITAPGDAGTITVKPAAAPAPAAMLTAARAIATPVHVDADPFDGEATIAISYDPATLPAGTDPRRDLELYTYIKPFNLWLPMTGTVDAAAHTVTATTSHFSDWVLAVTDPRQLTDERAMTERLKKTTGGKIGQLIAGKQDELTCNASHPLLPARATSTMTSDLRLCQELLPDGTYQLDFVNTTGAPLVVPLPPGFTETHPSRGLDAVVQRAIQNTVKKAAGRSDRGALIPVGGTLQVRFRGEAVTPGLTLTATPDWSLAMLTAMRKVTAAALLPDGDSDNQLAGDAIDTALSDADLYDCYADATDEVARTGGTRDEALDKVVHDCAVKTGEALGSAAEAAAGDEAPKSGKKAADKGVRKVLGSVKAVGKAVGRRLEPWLAVPDLMDLSRLELSMLAAVPQTLAGPPLTVTIAPSRSMTWDEAQHLASTPPEKDPLSHEHCADPTGQEYPPAGMPVRTAQAPACVQVVAADLDGNGTQDRLITWHPTPTARTGGPDVGTVGAVAYLDDGSVHRLENPPSSWKNTGVFEPAQDLATFGYRTTVHLANDRRAQVLLTAFEGASSQADVVLAVSGTGRQLVALEAPGTPGAPFTIFESDSWGQPAGFGCGIKDGEPLLVTKDASTKPTDGAPAGYDWTREFYRLEDVALRKLPGDNGTSGPTDGGLSTIGATAGSDCSAADPARRGPAL